MKNKRKLHVLTLLSLALLLTAAISGCAQLSNYLSTLKGDLLGNDYIIQQYDDFGNLVLTAEGKKVSMEGQVDTAGELTSYVDITIDGYEWQHVGSTLVFAQRGVDMVTDFQVDSIGAENGGSSGLIAVDRYINHYRNLFGKGMVVLVSSQTGTPIGLFQGNSCYVEIPEDLPKTTRLNIDGKAVYIHRGNVDIIPLGLLSETSQD